MMFFQLAIHPGFHVNRIPKGDLVLPCIYIYFSEYKTVSSGRGSFLALSAAGHAGDPPVHHGASVGPGRVPWRVLWALKVAKSGK